MMRIILLSSAVIILLANLINSVSGNPCLINGGGCAKKNGRCWGTGNTTHFCTCDVGYREVIGRNGRSCVDIDECALTGTTPVCGENSVCQNKVGGYECECKCGFVPDYTKTHCLDPSLITGNCLQPKSCYDTFWFYRRSQFEKFYGNFGYLTLVQGQMEMVEKQKSNDQVCECALGFIKNQCGYCVDIDECKSRRFNICPSRTGICYNTPGSYYCGCKAGYTLGPCGTQCYRQSSTIPVLCDTPDLSSLVSNGTDKYTKQSTFPSAIPMLNWRTCAPGVNVGDETTEEFDLDSDGVNDIRLVWVCSRQSSASPVTTSTLKLFSEEDAEWREWTCWSQCKATCWGGVQTRTRICLHGIPGGEGCPGAGSQKRNCYSGKKCEFRIRRNANSLSRTDKLDFMQAMEKYKQDKTATGFHNAGSAHGWPMQCRGISCCPHGAKMKFITWHRSIILNFEQGLTRHMKNKKLGVPYWNWLETAQRLTPPELAWERTLFGRPNPFTTMEVLIDRTGPGRDIQRDYPQHVANLNSSEKTWKDITTTLMKNSVMHEFSESLEGAHGGPHVSLCGGNAPSQRCAISFAVLNFAGFDPMFMFHHSQVDRLWAVMQKKVDENGTTAWTPQSALEALEPASDFGRRFEPFDNKTLNPFPLVQATNTMEDAYYYEELMGYKYDNIDNNGYPPFDRDVAGVSPRVLRIGGREILFIGQYLHNVEFNVHVNYYAYFGPRTAFDCSNFTANRRIGSTLILGTTRPNQNSIPRLITITTFGISDLGFDFGIKACYTFNGSCTERCPQASTRQIDTLPDPVIIHYIPNQPVDIYKFRWEEGARMPDWPIAFDSSSQWVYFLGNRSSSIIQVNTFERWNTCNAIGGKPFECNTKACMLRAGLYYLIDTNRRNCLRGLRMILASKK